jgi:trigger factor
MVNFKKIDLGKSTYQFDIIIPKNQISQKYNQAFEHLSKELEVPGFRKGKAPKNINEKHIKKEVVYNKVINDLIPEIYQELLKQEDLKPIITPKVELIKAKENEDWLIKIIIAERPKIDLKNYKELIKNIKLDEKKKEIWIPGTSAKQEPTIKDKENNKIELLNKIFDILLKNVAIEISDVIIEVELNRKLVQLIDDVRKVGLTIEQYLKSKNETIDSLKQKYSKEIENTYKLEFILEDISNKEKIIVENKDLEIVFNNIKDEKNKQEAKKNAYLYAAVIRKQKALDFLLTL